MKLRLREACGPWTAAMMLAASASISAFGVDTFAPYCEPKNAGPCAKAIWLIDDFEDGNLDGWLDGGGACLFFLIHGANSAAEGEWCLEILDSCAGHYQGTHISLAGFQAGSFTIWVRALHVDRFNSYVVLDDDQVAANGNIVFFYGNNQGNFMVTDHTGTSHNCGTRWANIWHQIRFDIDWDFHTFDVYVDNDLRQADIPFPVTANTLNWLYLYNMGDGATWYDYIVASTPPPTPILFVDGFEIGDWSAWSGVFP